jgi:acyl-CoA-binding protein
MSHRDPMDELLLISIENDFEQATKYLSEKKGIRLDNTQKLKFYALFKQALEGHNTKPKPGMLDFAGRAKWYVLK